MTDKKTNASTGDIPQAPQNKAINPAWKTNQTRLLHLRHALRARQSRLTQAATDQRPRCGGHQGDAGEAHYDQDFALSLLSSDPNALYQIEMALDRIRNGTYGICELSGDPIETDRLKAVPWARYTLSAQRMLERHGSATRTRLPRRQELSETAPGARSGDSPGNEQH